jgi:hypothetical protein
MAVLLKTQEKDSNLLLDLIENNGVKEVVVLSKYHLNFLEIKRLKKEGHSIKGIYRQTGVHKMTIRRYLEHEEYPEPAPPSTHPIEVRDYEAYIQDKDVGRMANRMESNYGGRLRSKASKGIFKVYIDLLKSIHEMQ